jgi:hypothetical protein
VIVVDGAVRVDIVIPEGLRARSSLFPMVRFPSPRPKGARKCLSAGCWNHPPDPSRSPPARSDWRQYVRHDFGPYFKPHNAPTRLASRPSRNAGE